MLFQMCLIPDIPGETHVLSQRWLFPGCLDPVSTGIQWENFRLYPGSERPAKGLEYGLCGDKTPKVWPSCHQIQKGFPPPRLRYEKP